MITFHDVDEIETGDVPTYQKTDKDREDAVKSLDTIFSKSPNSITSEMKDLFFEHEEKGTPEARFVNALDKIEPSFHLLAYPDMARETLSRLKVDFNTQKGNKIKATEGFPIMQIFLETATEMLVENGSFENGYESYNN